ncbi:hypothetical protein AX17_001193 [Amanita inopinata Kibby_2008]|nr:hypothetical protein AX17_001193 [Amanita inopinata Kibby_2008]
MPPKHSLSLLFHPKKNAKADKGNTSPRKPIVPRPKPSPEKDEDEELKLPDGPFQEFKLMSSALNGWKYDVMKFDSRKAMDISKWTQPIRLNRKELRKDAEPNAAPTAVGPMLGPDGKPVIGADGKIVMVDAEGRPIQPTDSSYAKDAKGKTPAMNGKKRFQKKTRQVFYVPEEVRQLRKEERYPWVMEDSSQTHDELWVGQLEDVSKSETHAFFMPAANDVFKFVPAHRWYKFQKKLKHDLPTNTAEVESLYSFTQKRDPHAWLAGRNGRGPSAATAAMFKAEAEGGSMPSGSSLVYSSGSSLGPGGRRLKTVDSGMNGLFDDEDDLDARRRREREYGGEGDLDEQVYEEDFADDEERVDADEDDEEAKEVEERLKREYRAANKQRDAGVVDSDEEEIPTMSKQAKAMQRLIRNREGNEAYESDEEKNPYASSEEEEEDLVTAADEAAVQPPATQSTAPSQPDSRAGSQTPKPSAARPASESRATSPVPSAPSPNHGGHLVVAKRAMNDKTPKPSVSRGNSPIGSRATSPVTNSRATSPIAQGLGSRAGSPISGQANNNQKVSQKRKAEDVPNGAPSPGANAGGVPPKPKKRKAQSVVPMTVSAAELKGLLVDWLKNTPNATTRDCIHHFTPYLTNQDKKTEFSTLVREVAQLKNGVLVLRPKSFTAGAPASPTPNT